MEATSRAVETEATIVDAVDEVDSRSTACDAREAVAEAEEDGAGSPIKTPPPPGIATDDDADAEDAPAKLELGADVAAAAALLALALAGAETDTAAVELGWPDCGIASGGADWAESPLTVPILHPVSIYIYLHRLTLGEAILTRYWKLGPR